MVGYELCIFEATVSDYLPLGSTFISKSMTRTDKQQVLFSSIEVIVFKQQEMGVKPCLLLCLKQMYMNTLKKFGIEANRVLGYIY